VDDEAHFREQLQLLRDLRAQLDTQSRDLDLPFQVRAHPAAGGSTDRGRRWQLPTMGLCDGSPIARR
jgi:hypothetical protein